MHFYFYIISAISRKIIYGVKHKANDKYETLKYISLTRLIYLSKVALLIHFYKAELKWKKLVASYIPAVSVQSEHITISESDRK